jgi:hypothetical protein
MHYEPHVDMPGIELGPPISHKLPQSEHGPIPMLNDYVAYVLSAVALVDTVTASLIRTSVDGCNICVQTDSPGNPDSYPSSNLRLVSLSSPPRPNLFAGGPKVTSCLNWLLEFSHAFACTPLYTGAWLTVHYV